MEPQPRRSGIPVSKLHLSTSGRLDGSMSKSNGDLLRISMSPSPTAEEPLHLENAALKTELKATKKQLLELRRQLEREKSRDSTATPAEGIQLEQKRTMAALQVELDNRNVKYRTLLEKNAKFRQRLSEILPAEDPRPDASLLGGISHVESRVFVGDEDMDGAIVQVEKLKNYMSRLELQIYEMNEKVSELIESSHQYERENKTLKMELENINNVAKIVTENMKDGIETNARLEDEIRRLRSENGQLLRQVQVQNAHLDRMTRPPPPTPPPRDLNRESSPVINTNGNYHPPIPKKPESLAATKRITEMHQEELTQVIQDELTRTVELLNYRLEVAERDLSLANNRAEVAEMRVTELQRASRLVPANINVLDIALLSMSVKASTAPPPPAPPPPPPPPLPPPISLELPKLKLKTRRGSEGNNNHHLQEEDSKKGESTGMDALISELKNGRVTLRRRRQPSTQQGSTNAALKELFQVLEQSQQRNRSSKTFLINHKFNVLEEGDGGHF